jgi:hypothetical protein
MQFYLQAIALYERIEKVVAKINRWLIFAFRFNFNGLKN